MPFLIPFIPAIATVGAAAIGASASNKAANKAAGAATAAADQNNQLQRDIYTSNKATLDPFVSDGRQADDVLGAFLGLSGDPAKAQEALDTFLGSTGYQFTQDAGSRAVTSSAAARGSLNSGATLKALQDRGQETAKSFIAPWMSALEGRSNRGVSAASAIAGVGQSYAGAVGANNNSAADATGNAALVGASNTNSLLSSALQLYGQSRGGSSYGNANNQTAPVFSTLPQPRTTYYDPRIPSAPAPTVGGYTVPSFSF
jgi:hypothetical protein